MCAVMTRAVMWRVLTFWCRNYFF